MAEIEDNWLLNNHLVHCICHSLFRRLKYSKIFPIVFTRDTDVQLIFGRDTVEDNKYWLLNNHLVHCICHTLFRRLNNSDIFSVVFCLVKMPNLSCTEPNDTASESFWFGRFELQWNIDYSNLQFFESPNCLRQMLFPMVCFGQIFKSDFWKVPFFPGRFKKSIFYTMVNVTTQQSLPHNNYATPYEKPCDDNFHRQATPFMHQT